MPYDVSGNYYEIQPDGSVIYKNPPAPAPAPTPQAASYVQPTTTPTSQAAPATTGGEVYGGYAWIQQLLDALTQAAGLGQQAQLATGYVQPTTTPPTNADALQAIYEAKPKLQAQHAEKYPNWSVTKYMQHWLEETGELREGREWTDELTGLTYVNTKVLSPIEFAISHGMMEPFGDREDWGAKATGEVPEGTVTPWGRWPEKEKTLAREAYEKGLEQWDKQFLLDQGLTEAQINQIQESIKLNRDQYDQSVIESNRNYLRAQGLDDEDVRRWEAGQEQLKDATEEDKRRWNESFAREVGLDEEATRQFNEQMTLSYYAADQAQSQFETEQLRLAGLGEQAAYEFQQTHNLAVQQFERGGYQWGVETALGAQQQAHQQRMEELGLLATQRGPENWLQYSALQSALGAGPLPAWQQALMQQQGQEYVAPQAEGVEFGGPAAPTWGQQYLLPQQMQPAEWYGMEPSQQAMLQGLVESPQAIGGYGGYWPDWMNAMSQSWATGGPITGISQWGG